MHQRYIELFDPMFAEKQQLKKFQTKAQGKGETLNSGSLEKKCFPGNLKISNHGVTQGSSSNSKKNGVDKQGG